MSDYTGKPYDVVTGMYNYGYRDYQPEAVRFTTEDPIRDGTNWFAYVDNDPINYIDILGLWILKGDGTAIAEPGDTLWGLAKMVTGSGSNWTGTNYSGIPENLAIGQVVDYKAMTTQVPTNAYIILGSVHNETSVKESFASITIIFNSQGVPITHNLNIQYINNLSSKGEPLSSITISDSDNRALLDKIGNGVLGIGGNEVPLLDPSGKTFTFIFTDNLHDQGGSIGGVNFDGTTTAIISKSANKSTGAHEDGHILGLDHIQDSNGQVESPSGNLMGYERYGTNLSYNESSKARNYLQQEYPKAVVLSSAKAMPDQKGR
jgi:RHS repeat-associated protein